MKPPEVSALLVIDKQPGPTSFDVVRQVRRRLGGMKVGHAGSLDPFASGVLILLTGKATKSSNLLLTADKKYLATLMLGSETNTLDRTGETTATAPVPDLSNEAIETAVKSFQGEWWQTPPMFSAKKKDGVRLYELARKNITIDREPIAVQLFSLEVKKVALPLLEIEVHCSKGTYIRSLAAEIGKRLGTLAHLAELRRLTCGEFVLEESLTVNQFEEGTESAMKQGRHHLLRLNHRPTMAVQVPSRFGLNPEEKGMGNRPLSQPSFVPAHLPMKA
jgi:tRNA pseudouridine55 synthase